MTGEGYFDHATGIWKLKTSDPRLKVGQKVRVSDGTFTVETVIGGFIPGPCASKRSEDQRSAWWRRWLG